MAVIGSDRIGAGITQISIDKNLQVILYDTTLNALSCDRLQIEKSYLNSIQRNRITKYKEILIISLLFYSNRF
jgi:3-hydroxyacyl-CoA dehydrogenase